MIKSFIFYKHSQDLLFEKLFVRNVKNPLQTIVFSMRVWQRKRRFCCSVLFVIKTSFHDEYKK